MNTVDRYRGCLLGLAAGDALGTTLEFKPPGSLQPITDICGGGPFSLKPGQWTDDTSMALCLAESLLQCNGFDPRDQMQRYWRWYQHGENSSTGACFDIGGTTRQALQDYHRTGQPYSGSNDEYSAGNGSLMRLAPVPLFFATTPDIAIPLSADSSRTTHGAAVAVDACRYFAGLILGAVLGKSKEDLLSAGFSPIAGLWQSNPLSPIIADIAVGSFKSKNPPAIKGSGYAAASLEAALWAFLHSTNFVDGALLAVNLGDDADTTGAIYGQLAGAYYGEAAIPADWCKKLHEHNRITAIAEQLYQASEKNR
jgi:ADP-ribosyl-[dinitrogen reductase] hydrolase